MNKKVLIIIAWSEDKRRVQSSRGSKMDLLAKWMNINIWESGWMKAESTKYIYTISKKKVPFLTMSTKPVGNWEKVGKYALEVRMKMLETVIMPSLMYGVEAFSTLTPEEISGLNSLQHHIMCDLLGMPKTTPYSPLLMVHGRWNIEWHTNN